jgi:hypothetical protein
MRFSFNGIDYFVAVVDSLGGPRCVIAGRVALVTSSGNDQSDFLFACAMIRGLQHNTYFFVSRAT